MNKSLREMSFNINPNELYAISRHCELNGISSNFIKYDIYSFNKYLWNKKLSINIENSAENQYCKQIWKQKQNFRSISMSECSIRTNTMLGISDY